VSLAKGALCTHDVIDASLQEGTPYQGGYFRVKFEFNEEFPAAPPRCTDVLSHS
jgi:ubiquitin-protein ligase